MLFIGEISALTAAVLWSFSSILFTSAAIKIGSIQLNIDRMLFATLFLIISILIFNIGFNVNSHQLFYLIISGFIGLVVGDTAIFKSFSLIGPRYTMLFYSINPYIAALFGFFLLNEKLTFLSILGMFITIIGIIIVTMGKKVANNRFHLNLKGIFYGVLSAFGQGLGLIFAKLSIVDGSLHIFTATFYRIFSATIILFFISLFFKKYKNPLNLYYKDKKSLKYVFWGSIIGPFLGITLSFVALSASNVGVAATLMSTTPIIIIPITMYFYHEKLNLSDIFGSILAVIGIALLFIK